MIYKTLLVLLAFGSFLFSQEISRITLLNGEKTYQIPAYSFDGNTYISLQHVAEALALDYNNLEDLSAIEIESQKMKLTITGRNPYVILHSKEENETRLIQLTTSAHVMDKTIFAPMPQAIDLLSFVYEKPVIIVNPNRIMVVDDEEHVNTVVDIRFQERETDTYLKVNAKNRIVAFLDHDDLDGYTLKLRNTSLIKQEFSSIIPVGLVKDIQLNNVNNNAEINITTVSRNCAVELVNSSNDDEIYLHVFVREDSEWFEKESEHFKIVYRETHSHLVNHLLSSAENALLALMDLFDYNPSEKIIIATYDVSDYGFSTTTTIPQNYIRLEIEPLEPGYEVVPYNERYQWLLSHELVHIVVNDQSSGTESFFRKIFGKVIPEKTNPLTVAYSLLTNYQRYTPRWYQEAIAVFIETWFSGGYGRILGNFDEMYFRTMLLERKRFPTELQLETIEGHNSFLLETLFYLYGARFVSYLSIEYGAESVINWFKEVQGDPYIGFESKFEEVFGKDFDLTWYDFIVFEEEFQRKNIDILKSSELTEKNKISKENFGWITQPYYDKITNSVFFGYHRSHELASLQQLDLSSGISKNLNSLPTPSMLQVSSTAFDKSNGLFFYTTNNNQLYRDIWAYDIVANEKKLLFENARVGDLAISSVTHDLWGVLHDGGITTLVVSPYPYHELLPVITFTLGDELFNLSIDNTGTGLAAILKRSSGQQSLITTDLGNILEGSEFKYHVISSSGTPENPSWSSDGNFIYWNAYTNGVANIYRYSLKDESIKAISHCLTGLFKPIEINTDSLFAFEFTTEGFVPIILKNESAFHLPAINYLGQKVLDRDPQVFDWVLPNAETVNDPLEFGNEKSYNGLANLNIQSIVPVVSGFQNQVVFGLFTHVSDPMLHHDFVMEFGFSPLQETPGYPSFHLRFKYDYKQKFFVELSHHGPEFFDIFNKRKRGMLGTKLRLNYTHYWLYDNPHKIKQTMALTLYSGVEFINDNLVRVSESDFGVFVTNLNSNNLRKSIGSSDYEHGNDIFLTFTLYGTNFEAPQYALNTYLEISDFSTWLWHHNVLHVKFAGGYLLNNDNLVQARFYFGGFGNRGIDNDQIRQYRKVFRFPGLPIYSLDSDKFLKILIENDFPPVRFGNLAIGDQFINHIDFAIYSQGMVTKNSALGNYWIDLGAQLDIKLKHWYNLESTFSMGIAKTWSDKMTDWEWFLSLKLLRD
jgi:hypothetical protein